MAVELKVPPVGESVTEGQVGEWLKTEGDPVRQDEPVVVLETDKATMEVPSPVDGRMGRILKARGERVVVGEVLGYVEEGGTATAATPPAPAVTESPGGSEPPLVVPATREPSRVAPAAIEPSRVMPAARAEALRTGVPLESVTPTGPGGRVLKEDVVRAAQAAPATPPPAGREDEVVPMTLLRRRIAERLVQAQSQAALLTTFNEIDLSAYLALRKRLQDAYVARHGVKLGLMSIFVKAAIDALLRVPQLNAEIRGQDVVYHRRHDIGVAVGGGRGLVVPVLRDADGMSLAAIEKAIADFAERARQNRLELHELQGGTFTISNGGVYGSLLSTPIVNPPQSGVLGLHAIQDRPVARDGQVVIRPMMYVALTYDHRLVDGREAVSFLVRVKEVVEDPARLLLEA